MKKEKYYDIIKRPLITEKTTTFSSEVKPVYTFEVDIKAEKAAIKEAVEGIFGVTVKTLNTVIRRGKIVKRHGRGLSKKSNMKKAYITLKEGDKISFMDGM